MGAFGCHGNQSFIQTAQNLMLPFAHPNDASQVHIKFDQDVSEIFKFESVDGRWTIGILHVQAHLKSLRLR